MTGPGQPGVGFSQGPWTADGTAVYGANKRLVAVVRDHGTVAALYDARLIAAAPELYRALDNFVRWDGYRSPPNDELLPADQQPNEEVANAMRVLAKVRGEVA